jgi:hypothetical protein
VWCLCVLSTCLVTLDLNHLKSLKKQWSSNIEALISLAFETTKQSSENAKDTMPHMLHSNRQLVSFVEEP